MADHVPNKGSGVFYDRKAIHTIEAASHAAPFPVHTFPTANYWLLQSQELACPFFLS